ncbi:hypothetical protein ASPVEDRAFT_402863 [Aspergillus versicolor CBS 583.65]|uniref:Uncharacterized protein n=1 Tax=Aspergillus versicolor CBS 583.65 TaxID=1036611 RepID=A0A1L9Q4B1_ASPVE|nr:uncharacterized protein ASPVEDRAFT_402863 [Aspergillus versicolor CBS 583.65]OJJ08569.1 hypothetical protein ASPVEDRAFT_402863 [Aspergillus versicolor CBS 583.65]
MKSSRLVVYSPIEEKRLWDYPYDSHIPCPNSPSVTVPVPFGPVALGQSYAYCVSTEAHSGWALMAYDFRTGKEVYCISKGVQWFRSANAWLAEGRPVPERLVQLVEVNGEELLIWMSEPKLTETTVEIIRGRDGQPVYSLEYSSSWKLNCLADPLTNQVALIWYKPAERAANSGRSITLIRTFSYQPGQPFTLSPLIAVERKTPCSEYETLQPFTMTDIEVVTLASEKRGKFTIARSCLLQVDSQRIRNLAFQAAIELFTHAPRHIRCYTTDSPRTVTVSESGSSLPPGSQNSNTLSVDTVPTPAVYWLDHARLVVQTMNYTRVVQF